MTQNKLPITAIIITKNEQNNIVRALKSVNFCEFLIIIDDFSNDQTIQIAKKFGATVYSHRLNNNYAAQRNFALTKAKTLWVLFIDADEFVTPQLARLILKAIQGSKHAGYYIQRKDVFMGKSLNHGEWGSQLLLRLGKKGNGVWKRSIHEFWDIKGNTQTLDGVLMHYPHPSLNQFISSIKARAQLHSNELIKEKKDNFLEFRLITNPIGKFLRNMFIYKGILDGTYGFVFAILLSFQSFISWSQIWIKKHKQ